MLAAASTYQSNIFNTHFRSHSDTTNYKSQSFHHMASNQPKYRKSTSADILMNKNKSIATKTTLNSETPKHAPSSSFPSTLDLSSSSNNDLHFPSSSIANVDFSDLYLLPSKKRALDRNDDETRSIASSTSSSSSSSTDNNNELDSFPKFKKAKTAPSSPDLIEAPMTPPPTSSSGALSSPQFTLKPISASTSAAVEKLMNINESTTMDQNIVSNETTSNSRLQSQEPHTPPSSCNNSPISSPMESIKPKIIKTPIILDYVNSLSFPDTSYSFLSVQTSKLSNERNAPISELQNDEWRDFYLSNLKQNDIELHRRYKEYTNNQSKITKEKYSLKKPTLSSIVSLSPSSSPVAKTSTKISTASNSRITKFIENQYIKYNQSITNFPYRNNYTYLSSGYKNDIQLLTSSPELYKRQSIPRDYTRPMYPNQHVPSPQITNPYNYSLTSTTPPTLTTTTTSTSTYHRTTAIQSPSSTFTNAKSSMNITPPSSPPSRHVITTPMERPSHHRIIINSSTSPSEINNKNITLTPVNSSTTNQIKPPSTPSSPTVNKFVQSSINGPLRSCISCHASQSPCWRPSWSSTEGQLCNSCGLRYKKTGARCLNEKCLRIPAKGEWTLMKSKGKVNCHVYNSDGQVISNRMSYRCLHCDGEVELQTGRD